MFNQHHFSKGQPCKELPSVQPVDPFLGSRPGLRGSRLLQASANQTGKGQWLVLGAHC